jgi:hypothetical protein
MYFYFLRNFYYPETADPAHSRGCCYRTALNSYEQFGAVSLDCAHYFLTDIEWRPLVARRSSVKFGADVTAMARAADTRRNAPMVGNRKRAMDSAHAAPLHW